MKKQLLFSVILGFLGAGLVILYLFSLESEYKRGAQRVSILAARESIDSLYILEPSMCREILIPKEFVQPKAISSLNELLNENGRPVYMTLAPIEKDEQIMLTKLSLAGTETGISMVIPEGKQALTVAFNSELVEGIIKPGNKVDIIGVFDFEEASGNYNNIAVTILQNLLVLSVGDDMLGSVFSAGKKPAGNDSGFISDERYYDSVPVTFALTPQEAELLFLAVRKGEVVPSVRPMGEQGAYVTKGISFNELLKGVYSGASSVRESNVDRQKQKEILSILERYQR